jgi:RHS repeat-associated protein
MKMKPLKLVVIAVFALCAKSIWSQTVPIYNYSVPAGGYLPNGNLSDASDTTNGHWSNLQYDGANRLKSGTLDRNAQPTQYFCWTYDSFGNRTTQATSDQGFQIADGASCQVAGTLITNIFTVPDSSNRIATTNATGVVMALTYDAAGNMTFDGKNYYAYDAESHLCGVVSESGVLTQYLYNADGQRVAKGHSKSGNTLACASYGDFAADEKYILGQNGENITELIPLPDGTDQWKNTNVYNNGQLLATYDQEGTQLLHFNITDPLGTKRVQASASGAPELNWTNFPFGDGLLSTGSGRDATTHHFTGKERDPETGEASGLDYFGARYYTSSLGRFTTPDYSDEPEAVPFSDLNNPQSLNLYGYVQNNPLTNADTAGHVKCSDGTDADACVTTDLPDAAGLVFANNVSRIANQAAQVVSNAVQNLPHIMNTPGGPSCVGSLVAGGAMAVSGAMAFPGLAGAAGGPAVLLTEGAALLGGGVAGGAAGAAAAMSACPGGGSGGSGGGNRVGKQGKFWKGLKNFRNEIKTNGQSGSARRFYTFDYTHQDVEVFNGQGTHLGSADPETGAMTKPAVAGRTLKNL